MLLLGLLLACLAGQPSTERSQSQTPALRGLAPTRYLPDSSRSTVHHAAGNMAADAGSFVTACLCLRVSRTVLS